MAAREHTAVLGSGFRFRMTAWVLDFGGNGSSCICEPEPRLF